MTRRVRKHPEFDSRILHDKRRPFLGSPFFVVKNVCYPPPKSPSCEGDFSLRSLGGSGVALWGMASNS